MTNIVKQLATELNLKEQQLRNTISLIDEGCTIPFIARYRKEVTGGLDDVVLRELDERLRFLRNLEARKEEVNRLIDEQGKLTPEIINSISNATTLTELEDIYRPFRPKRRTRATVAKEKGLEPLADLIWNQNIFDGALESRAEKYLNPEKEVDTVEQALQYAMDIIAERISDDAENRKFIRNYTFKNGVITTKATSEESSVYDMYYNYQEAVNKIVPHRVLAINRGEKEKFLSVSIALDDEALLELLVKRIVKNDSIGAALLAEAIKDSYKRLIAPSIEREIRNVLTEAAEEQAIKVFSANLKNLLLQPPVKGKVVMGMDPGFRTGNKIAIVDETGKVLDTGVVYITLPNHNIDNGKAILRKLIEKHNVNIIAIGNGTASKESEIVTAQLIKELDQKVQYIIVNEAGASVYSASKLGAEEFPDFDVALRSAISIARRLQDPLSELVKIDPKSIGVGQYQHDINQKRLAESLQGVVEYCVNTVGVDLNTASSYLLQYISGISPAISKNIIAYREKNGKFKTRQELLNVPRLGEKTFQQCAGFLRIPDGESLLDNTAVHPESYAAVEKLFEIMNFSMDDIKNPDLKNNLKSLNLEKVSQDLNIGVPTLSDIISELLKPGRDPRDELPGVQLRVDVLNIEDLKPQMILTGTVRNVTDFGVFVDIGVHHDGLVHISQLSNKYVKHPMDVVQVGDIVNVKILDVDVERGRISLTMKDL